MKYFLKTAFTIQEHCQHDGIFAVVLNIHTMV